MCDYSIQGCKTRDARVGDRLVSGRIRTTDAAGWTSSKGFYAEGDDGTAVCLRTGTELAFEDDVRWRQSCRWLEGWDHTSSNRTAIFSELDVGRDYHHDALEFPDGNRVKVAWLSPGQTAIVLQLPATAKHAHAEEGVDGVRLPELSPADA